MQKLCVVIPAYNEEKSIPLVVKGVYKSTGKNTTIVVVNDGSKDKTAELAKSAGAHVISFASNRGLVSAFKTGLKYALSIGANMIVTIDGDGQHNPYEIPLLLEPINKRKADLVIGSRFRKKGKHPSAVKHFGNEIFSSIISSIIKQRVTDAQCGFRAFTREVAEELKIREGYTYTQQMIIEATYNRFKIVEVPVSSRPRKGRSRLMRNPLHFAYNAGGLLLSIFAMYYPLKFFGFFGLLLMVFGALLGLIFQMYDVLSSLIIATGIQFILFGVLFEIIRKN